METADGVDAATPWTVACGQGVSSLNDRNLSVIFNLVVQAVQAAEQARRKGELDQLLDSLGLDLPVDLKDEDRCREYAIASVQAQLNKYPWGHLISVATIYEKVLAALRQDAHKGPAGLYEELTRTTPEQLAQGLPRDLLAAANAIASASAVAQAGLSTSKDGRRR